LFQLVWQFCEEIARRKGFSAEQVMEYVMGNTAAWVAPRASAKLTQSQEKEQETFEFKWAVDLACLDSALLSLVQQEVAFDDLAPAIDEALRSSLWERTLQRESEIVQRVARAILLGRADFIWRNSTAAQRKGYFAAGVSLATGHYLDEHADALNKSLQNADMAFGEDDLETAISATIEFANIVFAVSPFCPDEILENWQEILRVWVGGESMSDLAGGKDAEVLEFIEGALVYRLVWAMEAVRVREITTNGAGDEQSHAGRAAVAIETGTSNYNAALLIQAGLPSRVAAIKAVADCPADFHDFRGLRKWLASKCVMDQQLDGNWPTPDTASLWRAFVQSFEITAAKNWSVQTLELNVKWEVAPPRAGTLVRILHDEHLKATVVRSIELDRLGTVVPAFSTPPAGVLVAAVASTPDRIAAEYLGPFDLTRSNRDAAA
jgi:hypothetical protein